MAVERDRLAEPMKFYLRSLSTGYGMLVIGAGCSLVSVPLALHYLSAEKFGLWTVVLQIAGYFALIDTGVSSSVGRLLIDHRKVRPSREYGAIFWGGFVVLCAMATVVAAVGLWLVPFLPDVLRIDDAMRPTFAVLAGVQIVITAFSLPVRVVGQSVLSASRYDLIHLCLSASLLANLAALWMAFLLGAGIYAFVWAGAAGLVVSAVLQVLVAVNQRTLPNRGEHCLPTRGEWRPLLGFARDVVFLQVGGTLVFSTQSVIVGSTLGLTAAATWAAGSKLFTLFLQVAGKVSEVAGPQMAEMHVAEDGGRLAATLRKILCFTVLTAGVGAIVLVAGNSIFVTVWTGGKISWPYTVSIFLAVWLVLSATANALTAHSVAQKRIAQLRYVFLLEGIVGTAAAWWIAPVGGIAGIAAVFACACLCFSFRVTVWHAVRTKALAVTPV